MNFVDGVVQKGKVRVPALDDAVVETKVKLPSDGSAVSVGPRPPDISPAEAESSVKVDLTEELGGVAFHYVRTATGERIVVESKGKDNVHEDATVKVGFDNDKAMFFDKASEKRLR